MLTSVIGTVILIIGIIISFLQWSTAQQKVALEISDSRFGIYDDLRFAVSDYLMSGQFSVKAREQFIAAQSRARFKFGQEVDDYLTQILNEINTAHLIDRYERPLSETAIDNQVARISRINAFYTEIDKKFIPYMRLDQRMPLWWLSQIRGKWASK